ncbi:MAG: FG-GAP repeat protein [Kordiimonadaceae bacterium]|nr:FG-GAP repeat protein [Kordiimonadaceae bacterium]MBO6570489.1 FG-GAP repeat protein [Kordiimonadaceae bacterium]MBO6966392.1 FG-GAP repeat protein [Kordiimonadaceae bacterium]
MTRPVVTGSINVADLDGSNGFSIFGTQANTQFGYTVSGIGDVNGDGFDDIAVSAYAEGVGGNSGAGRVYIIFGQPGGLGAEFNLSSLDGSNGFVINGTEEDGNVGFAVSAAGDVNGDGIDDILIGTPAGNFELIAPTGAAYVVYGTDDGFGANLSLGSLNGNNGFTIEGESFGDAFGFSVSGGGDVNGDGIDDIVIGAIGTDTSFDSSLGSTFVLFGDADGFGATVDAEDIRGQNGYELLGTEEFDRTGLVVNIAGDINGDGIDDVISGSPFANREGVAYTGEAVIIFGEESTSRGDTVRINHELLGGYNGFAVDGLGDINGDGFDDVAVTAPNAIFGVGAVYVIFGSEDGLQTEFDLASIDGENGFVISGQNFGDFAGFSVGAAGDVNGDGLDDFIVGAIGADDGSEFDTGAAYVIFGRDDGFDPFFVPAGLDVSEGVTIFGANSGDGLGRRVSSAGDINGDGYDDLIVGAAGADSDDLTGSGAAYVIYGSANFGQVPVSQTGTQGSDALIGAGLDDTLEGAGGNDTLFGTPGADIMNGGEGTDTASYEFSEEAVNINLANGAIRGGDAARDTLEGIENLTGSSLADRLIGDALDNVLNGGDGDDTLIGADGADVLIGGAGADILDGRSGSDVADYGSSDAAININLTNGAIRGGDAARDTLIEVEGIFGSALADRIVGNAAANDLRGRDGADTLIGAAGNDTLFGEAGDDLLEGRENADFISAGTGDDTLLGGSGADRLRGDSGNDHISGDEGADSLNGGAGNDALYGGDSRDTLNGSDGNDTLQGGAGADMLDGGEDDDLLQGDDGADTIDGGEGRDTLTYSSSEEAVNVNLTNGASRGGIAAGDVITNVEVIVATSGDDRLVGDTSDNAFYGGAGDDTLVGADGDDTLVGGSGSDVLDGREGVDTASFAESASAVSVNLSNGRAGGGEARGDQLLNIENVIGSAQSDRLVGDDADNRLDGGDGDDTLVGGGGDDRLVGGSGNDLFDGRSGADVIIGGDGVDTILYTTSEAAVVINLNSGAVRGGDAAGDAVTQVENVTGSAFNDRLVGDSADNHLIGGDGNDVLIGALGNDTLLGGNGNDTLDGREDDDALTGGDGADVFIFGGASGNDVISDFDGTEDTLDLSGAASDFSSLSEVQAASTVTSSGLVLDLGGGDSVVLLGVALSDLTEDNVVI